MSIENSDPEDGIPGDPQTEDDDAQRSSEETLEGAERVRPSPEAPTLSWSSAPTRSQDPSSRDPEGASLGGEWRPGDRFGSYRLEKPLGRGGFGEVWQAVHEDSGRRVALKLLNLEGEASEEARLRFHREARLAASLGHPRCVFVFGAEEEDGRLALAMELVEGGTLKELLEARGRLPYRRAVDLVLDLVDGLEAAQRKGIIHRDIKPSNCFLDASGTVKIGDFGLSKTLEAEEGLTVTGTYLGTPAYSSPEQVRGRELDLRSDIFSLGALLYHLATGERPFGSGPATQVLARIVSEDPSPVSNHGVDLPGGLEKLLARMMAKEPPERFSSYEDLRQALMPFGSEALGAVALSKRLGAQLLDSAALGFVGALLGGIVRAGGVTSPEFTLQPAFQALGAFTAFLYFVVLEGRWEASLGKRLLGLRVTSAGGGAAGWRPILLRTGIFVGVPSLVGILLHHDLTLHTIGLYGTLGALLVTMRRRNGYAGIHELLSGTRVTIPPTMVRTIALPPPAPSKGATEREFPAPEDLRFGPYEDLESVWSREDEELFEGFDPLLERRVWIHTVEAVAEDEEAPPPGPGDRHPSSLQWLQGGIDRGRRWDAWERPDGRPLLAWLEQPSRTSWPDALFVLSNLARALAQASEIRKPRSLARLWVEPGGRVRGLPFGWRPLAESQGPPAVEPREGQALLYAAAGLLLERRIPSREGPSLKTPLPRSAREVLDRLGKGEHEGLEEALDELHRLRQRPATVSSLRRAAALVPAAVGLLVVLMGFAVALVRASEPASPRLELPARLSQWHELADRTGPEAERRRRAVAELLAQGTLEAQEREASREDDESSDHLPEDRVEDPDASEADQRVGHRIGRRLGDFAVLVTGLASRDLPRGVSTEEARLLAELATGRERLEDEEIAELRRIAGATRTGLWMHLSVLSVLEVLVALWGVLFATLLCGGLGLRVLLVEVQRDDGRAAGRVRCGVRALVAWIPFLIPLVIVRALGVHHPVAALAAGTAPLLLLAGALYACWSPSRGLQDRIAGTWLMPR